MNSIIEVIWPYLATAVVSAVALYIGYIHQLRMKMAVLEKTLENQQYALDNLTKRMDNHSKKQDDILEAIAALKVDIVRQLASTEQHISAITTEQAVIAADVKNIKDSLTRN
jgi:uncharacterized membrane-anchored protein YhcB (DUF1043 family)